MTTAPRLTVCAAFAAALSCGGAALAAPDVSAQVKGPDGKVLGSATFEDAPIGVLIRLDLKGLTPGWHGIHLHDTGACADAKFTSAGAHINHAPAKKPHGLLNPDGPDFGDLANIHVAADGTAQVETFSTFVSLKGSGGRPALLDENGSALVIHANPDDHTAQPIGGAGDRVGCAVIKASGGLADTGHNTHAAQ